MGVMPPPLITATATLQRHHVATPAEPMPPPLPGVTWIWAANGIFKRGVDRDRDLLIRVAPTPPTPGLAPLAPHVRFRCGAGRIPASLLIPIVQHARHRATAPSPIEQQYFILWTGGRFEVHVPAQDATAARVRYAMPDGIVLIDLHSHHQLRAFFSEVDDRDDLGLSVSAVLGRLDRPLPEMMLRVNVYGHRQTIGPAVVFEGPAVLATPAPRGSYAATLD